MVGYTDDNWEIYELNLALKLLNCPYMEKRLKGLVEIKDLIEVIDKDNSRKNTRNLSPDYLAKWLITSKVLETVMENSHEEMIKRTSSIIIFLAKNNYLNTAHMDLLLKYTLGRHNSLLLAVYQVIVDITMYIPYNLQKYFFQKISLINTDEYDEKFVKMITEFSIKAIDKEQKDYFALKILYDLCLDSSKAKLQDIAVESFIEVLKHVKSPDTIWNYLKNAVDNIKNFDSVPQFMIIVQKIMHQVILGFNYYQKEEFSKKIENYSGGIAKLLIKSFAIDTSDKKSVFSPTKNVKVRLRFLKFIVRSHFFDISIDEIVDLWKVITYNQISPKQILKFSKTMLKMIKNSFAPSTNSDILKKIYLSPDFSAGTITIESFDIFYELFLRVNTEYRNLEMKLDSLLFRINSTLIGLETLINILFLSETPEIISKSTKLLISLNLKFHPQLFSKREEIWTEFVNILHEYLIKSSEVLQVNKSLTLILQFLDNNIKKEEFTQSNSMSPYKNNTELDLNKSHTNLHSTSMFFSKCQFFQESLLELLPKLDQINADLAWTILNKVALIEKFVDQLGKFLVPYSEVFSTNSVYRLVYNLKIIEKLMKSPKWLEEFRNNSGSHELVLMYLNFDYDKNNTSSLMLEFNTVMISILNDIIKGFTTIPETLLSRTNSLGTENERSEVNLITKVLDSLVQTANSCTENENSIIIAKNAKEIINILKNNSLSLYLFTIKNYPIPDLLLSSFVKCSCKYFSTAMESFFLEQSQKIPDLNLYFLNSILGIFDSAILQNKCDSYWSLLSFYIKECEITSELQEKYLSLIKILDSWPAEQSGKDPDIILSGILKVLKTLIEKSYINVSESTVELVIHKCLFEIPTKAFKDPPKCKSNATRREAFDLLKQMCKTSPMALTQVISYLNAQHQDPHWRSSKSADWNYHPRAYEKSDTGYVGIKNLGCICYMISSLQQLFFIPNFRETILRINKTNEPVEEDLLYQMQTLYSTLKHSDKQHVNPKGLCRAFKDWEGRPVNVMEQMDADEFINTFMDRIETQIKGSLHQDVVKEIFTGQLATEIIGKNTCTHRSEVNEVFITLPVQVKNKKNLIESLESFKEGELLEGSNAYQCDYCESKVTALRRVCIKYLPNILFVTLRRFEFDYDTMKRVKVNDYCEFPMDINMENFTQEGIERLELTKEKEAAAATGKDFTKEIPGKKYPDDYYQYKLKGIVIHAGTAESGHYYSFIRENNQWYEFNDTVVRRIDSSDIPNEAFGGEEKFSYPVATGANTSGIKPKYRNAYILLYERSSLYVYRKEEEEVLKPLKYEHETNEIEFLEVKEENDRYWRCKSSFSPEYFDFILSLLGEKNDDICKFGICFFLTVMIRSRDFNRIVCCFISIKKHLSDSKEISEWMLELISYKYILKELFMDCPVVEKRRVMVGIVYSALKQVSADQQELFFQRLLYNIELAKKPISFNFSQYFELLYKTIKLNPNLISAYSVATRLIKYLKRVPQDPLQDPVAYKHSDIYLGYDKYTPTGEKSDLSVSENGCSLVFLISSLHLCIETLSDAEINYLYDENTLNFVLTTASTRHGGKVLGQFYGTLCINNKALTAKYGNYLVNGIDKFNADKHKPYMRQLSRLLGNSDNSPDKIDHIMGNYLKQILNNKKYPLATDSSIDFFIKIAVKIPAIKDWISKKAKELRWLENVLSEPSAKQPVKIKEPQKVFSTRIDTLRKILRGTLSEKDWEDSDNDLVEDNISTGCKVEYYDFQSQRWVSYIVAISSGELLQIKSENEGAVKWVENLDDRLRSKKKALSRDNE